MKDLSITIKFLVGFGSLLFLLVVVALVSVFGIRGVVGRSKAVIDGNELQAMLEERVVDHLNWASALNRLITDDTVSELTVETDPSQCRFGKWLYGQDRIKVEEAMPELKEALLAVENPHADLHGSAMEIKQVFEQGDLRLPGLLVALQVDLLEWGDSLRDAFLQNRNSISVETDSTRSSLGRWMQSNEARLFYDGGDADFRDSWEKMALSNADLHESAQKVVAAYSQVANEEARRILLSETLPLLEETIEYLDDLKAEAEYGLEGMRQAQAIYANQARHQLAEVQKHIDNIMEIVDANTLEVGTVFDTAGKISYWVGIISVVALIVGVFFAITMARSIILPLKESVEMITEMARGHLSMRIMLDRKDEIGQMANAMDLFAEKLQYDLVGALEKLAKGDLTFEVKGTESSNVIGRALIKTGKDLNGIVAEILVAAEEIASGAGQVADSSNALSQGASEQASSLEQVTSSMTEIASQTKNNADNAAQANDLAEETKKTAERGNSQMQEMVLAMDEISGASQNISKIIKTIDEIAFQTNLLALNAAVEAARAGRHGKGFAVVAEEVRSLAARSAKAARETAELIEGSVEKTRNGSEIAGRTAEALDGMVKSITEVSSLVSEIAASSREQSEGFGQVNSGISHIDQVTQQNTASAEEGASAAEELSSQAQYLKEVMGRFKLKDEAFAAVREAAFAEDEPSQQQLTTPGFTSVDSDA